MQESHSVPLRKLIKQAYNYFPQNINKQKQTKKKQKRMIINQNFVLVFRKFKEKVSNEEYKNKNVRKYRKLIAYLLNASRRKYF